MITILIEDKSTHPPIGAWVWGSQGVSYQVTDRYRQDSQFWLTLATDHGPVEMLLSRVVGWALQQPEQSPTPPPLKPGDPIEIFFPDYDQWRGGFRYLEPHKNPERCWLTDSRGIEHSSKLEFIRRETL